MVLPPFIVKGGFFLVSIVGACVKQAPTEEPKKEVNHEQLCPDPYPGTGNQAPIGAWLVPAPFLGCLMSLTQADG